MDVRRLAILFHFVPFQHFGLAGHQLIPGDMWATGVDFDHADAIINRANSRTEVAADAVFFPDHWAQAIEYFSLQLNRFHIDALVSSVIAGDITKVAVDAFVLIDASHRLEAQVEVAEAGDAG